MYLVDLFFFFVGFYFMVQYLHYYKMSRVFTKQTLGQKLYLMVVCVCLCVCCNYSNTEFLFFYQKHLISQGVTYINIINKVTKMKLNVRVQIDAFMIKACLSFALLCDIINIKLLYYHVSRRSVFYLVSVCLIVCESLFYSP